MTKAIGVGCTYRMMKIVEGKNSYYGIYEVFYDDMDRVVGFSDKPYTATYENNPIQTMKANFKQITETVDNCHLLVFSTQTEHMWEEDGDGKVVRKISYLRKDVI